MIRKNLTYIGFFIFALGIANYSMVADAPKTSTKPSPKTKDAAEAQTIPPINAQLFDEVLGKVRADFVDKVDEDKLLGGALNGMLTALDPHSAYLDPKEYKELQEQTKGEFGGLGIEVTMEDGVVKVVSPIDDTPAFKAGIEAGDLIIMIDKKPVMGLTINQAVDLMRGEPGKKVVLKIKRAHKDPFDVTVTREIIKVQPIKSRVEGNVGYIRISTFGEKTAPMLKDAILDIKKKLGNKLEGFVLDLRNDPGGLLDAAIESADHFLKEGEVVSTRGKDPKNNVSFKAQGEDLAEGYPIVVLINSGSASASEILAGALQDHHRAVVAGTKSFGKGSVQLIIPMVNGGAIKLTVARYYTPSGRSIQATGIEPDIIVEQVANLEKIKEDERIREADFIGALKNEHTPPKPNPEAEEPKDLETEVIDPVTGKKKEEVKDYQLLRAIDIVRAMYLAQKNPSK
ncbi:S41 family peptidase [Candidatus Bealeia paramacronuclearis]|uniref:S41 family peptidase n=1 Tax=Candidatus Bealeia paramacronuclearis TaxID=1921001 RepID=A0ABZ2C246_9PROT|nr:S41 family peptidase [Candidatus Bealeia paramacronuclearis]